MESYLKEFLFTTRAVILGRTDEICERLSRMKPEKLMAYEAAIGLLVGIQTLSPLRTIGFPVFLTGMTIIWIFLYAAMIEARRAEMMTLYRCFFGSSLILAPGVVPIVGPKLFELLLLGWPCVLARLIAHATNEKPGRIFLHLAAPVLGLFVTLKIVLLLAGNIFSLAAGAAVTRS